MFKIFIIRILLFLSIISCCCSGSNNETINNRLNSADYDSKEMRIELLSRAIKLSSKIENAEFELFNVNGFSDDRLAVPGASSFDYCFAVKVAQEDIVKWTSGLVSNDSTANAFVCVAQLTEKRNIEWHHDSKSICFYDQKGFVNLVVYQKEGIIFKRVKSL